MKPGYEEKLYENGVHVLTVWHAPEYTEEELLQQEEKKKICSINNCGLNSVNYPDKHLVPFCSQHRDESRQQIKKLFEKHKPTAFVFDTKEEVEERFEVVEISDFVGKVDRYLKNDL